MATLMRALLYSSSLNFSKLGIFTRGLILKAGIHAGMDAPFYGNKSR